MGSGVKNLPANAGGAGDTGSRHRVGKVPWRWKWQPTPVFLPEKFHGQRGMVGYSPWGHKKVGHNLVTKHTHTSVLKSVVQQWIPSSSSSPPCTAFKWLQLGLNSITGFKQSQVCCHLRRLKSVQFKRLHPDEAEFHLEASSEANLSCLYWLKIFCKAKIEFNLYL